MVYFGKTAGIIAAASKRAAMPMLQVGEIPIVRRIVISFQQAGIFPVVIVTGAEEEEVVHQLAPYGVIFLHSEAGAAPELFSSVKLGLSYLKGKCDRVIFTPVNAPMFAPDTLRQILAMDAPIVTPSYEGKSGHPIAIRSDVFDAILGYEGEGGLRGAMNESTQLRRWVSVKDEGILLSVHNEQQLKAHLKQHNNSLLAPTVEIGIEKEDVFFNERLELLLFLIADMSSVRKACQHMGLSYAKAWNMLNRLELETGYAVIERRHGGTRGGRTYLTERGEALMRAYQRFDHEIREEVHRSFNELFRAPELL